MRFRYRVWCPDCSGVDYQGCFDGFDYLSEETFATYEEADKAGDEYTKKWIWEYEVTEADNE